jgi:Tfp pilus assembly protein PilN
MESHKTVQAAAELPRRSPILLILAIFSVVALVAGAFYLGLQKSAIQAEQNLLDTEIVTLNTEIATLQSQKIQAAQLAQQWLDEVKSGEILWSHVINRIQRLLPVDPITQSPKIKVLSYSGSQGGGLVLNAQTVEAALEPYEYVSELLAVFNSSSDFSYAVIPSITRGETDQGMKFLSFSMSFDYQPEKLEPASRTPDAANDGGGGATQEAAPKVPRQ